MNKILVVSFLTLLIWTWAYLSQEQQESFSGSLEVAPSVDESILVTFSLIDSNVSLTKVPLGSLNFKGPPSAISDLQRKKDLLPNDPEHENLNFLYTPPPDPPEGTYTIELPDYLQKHSKTHKLALSLESCKPENVEVHIEKLYKKKLPIQPLAENGQPRKGVRLDPSSVTMFVRQSNDTAKVTLTQQDIAAARKGPIEVRPYVELGVGGVVRKSETLIKVSLLQEDLRKQQPFQPTSIGYIMSPELAGKYTVKLVNEDQLKEKTDFYATAEAMTAYENMRPHILIPIRDSDAPNTEIPFRPIIYNFPREFFKNGDIDIVEVTPPKTATIKLIPVNSTTAQ